MTSPYWSNGVATLYQADAREIPLPDGSVHCVVTSPPYHGLRDYNLSEWVGGDPECTHSRPVIGHSTSTLEGGIHNANSNGAMQGWPGGVCGHCGANQQAAGIGLEPSLSHWLANIVAVGREVKRVLRDDGCFFLNLGDSYSSDFQIISQYVRIREDLTEAEYEYVALALSNELLGMPTTDRQGSSEGDVSVMLRQTDESQAQSRPNPAPTSQGFSESFSRETPANSQSTDSRSESANTYPGDRGTWREVCLLRRDGTHIPLPRPHQRRRAAGISEVGEFCNDLQVGTKRRTANRQIPSPMLELQRGTGAMGLLSALTIDRSRIPTNLYPFFESPHGLGPKNLMGQPWRAAFALQDDGWILRSAIVWHKPNPMPESVSDRPTSAYEMVFLLTKRAHYFYDAEAVRESAEYGRGTIFRSKGYTERNAFEGNDGFERQTNAHSYEGGRNARNVWQIPTQGRPEAHFATFPDELPRRCILAGTSEHGVCADCGAPWERQTEKETTYAHTGKYGGKHTANGGNVRQDTQGEHDIRNKPSVTVQTVGWQPTCECNAADCPQHKPANKQGGHGPRHAGVNARWKESGGVPPKATDFQPTCTCDANRVPATVLDCFVGSGTTVAVAQQLGRRGIGLDLNLEYLGIAKQRIEQVSLPLF